MLAGLKDYLAVGLRPPSIAVAATKEYRREMDTTGQWIEAMCERSTIGAKLRYYGATATSALSSAGGPRHD